MEGGSRIPEVEGLHNIVEVGYNPELLAVMYKDDALCNACCASAVVDVSCPDTITLALSGIVNCTGIAASYEEAQAMNGMSFDITQTWPPTCYYYKQIEIDGILYDVVAQIGDVGYIQIRHGAIEDLYMAYEYHGSTYRGNSYEHNGVECAACEPICVLDVGKEGTCQVI